jgi:hypothetical protein
MNAEERARDRWKGAPKGCQHRERGFVCNRDANHTGRHYDPKNGGGYWGSEWRDLDGKPQPRRQFCDVDWSPPKKDVAAFYCAYEVGRDSLFTVGTLGGVYCTKENYQSFTDNLRKWADMIDKYMETYDG